MSPSKVAHPIPLRALASSSLALALATSIASADIRATSGQVVETGPPPSVVPGDWERDDQVRIFAEQSRVQLTADLAVDIVARGSYGPNAAGSFVIPAGTKVNSYLMHLDQVAEVGSLKLTGSVRFEEPVLGLIISDDRLDASDPVLGAASTTYPSPGLPDRGLNLTHPTDQDSVALTRRKVSVDLTIFNVADQVRVITGYQVAFSPDLGSDTEFADPFNNGNESLDQGDLYLSGGSLGAVAFWDDVDSLSMTFPDAVSPVPYGLPAGTCGAPGASGIYHQGFDLDGFDEVELSLSQYTIRPLYEEYVEEHDRAGIFGVESLLISFDDDSNLSWFACGSDNVPTESKSPTGLTYGQTAAQDEVIALTLAGATYPLSVSSSYGFSDEASLHPDLAPNPVAGSEFEDDDVDALDWLTVGRRPLFSTDHEGVGGWFDPALGMVLLSPGTIYQSGGGGAAPIPVITPSDLGLPLRVDLDAFELCWLEDPSDPQQRRALALVFSVDNNDPWTLFENESGGRNPNVIYYSFLDGAHAVLVEDLGDDVDAIAAKPAGSSSVGSPYCFGDGSGAACPCGNESAPGSGQGCRNSAGQGAQLTASGSTSVAADDLTFATSGMPGSVAAMLFVGQAAPGGGIGVPFVDGLRCAGGGIKRLGVRMTSGAGDASWGPGLGAGSGAWGSGDQRYFQGWNRDLTGPCGTGSNLTNGYSVLFTP